MKTREVQWALRALEREFNDYESRLKVADHLDPEQRALCRAFMYGQQRAFNRMQQILGIGAGEHATYYSTPEEYRKMFAKIEPILVGEV